MDLEYKNIKTPIELLHFMMYNIKYGYLGKNGKIHKTEDKDFNLVFEEEYILETKEDILRTGYGNCYDQTELARCWFKEHGFIVKTYFEMVNLNYVNPYPTHAFLVYQEGNTWNWFEVADFKNQGIHKFNSLEELLNYQIDKYREFLKTFNIKEEELNCILIKEFEKPILHSDFASYLNCCLSGKDYNKFANKLR